MLSRKRQYISSNRQHKLGSYHIGCRAILIALKTLQGHPAYRSVLVITETMVILREEISSQGSVSQSHAKAARFDQTISGSDIPEKGIIDFKADRIDILTITMIDELFTPWGKMSFNNGCNIWSILFYMQQVQLLNLISLTIIVICHLSLINIILFEKFDLNVKIKLNIKYISNIKKKKKIIKCQKSDCDLNLK